MRSPQPLPTAQGAATPRRLLVRAVNWLGDAVITTPALARLREALPQTHITLLTHEKLADLWTHHPALDQVMTFRAGENPWSVSRRLRAAAFDAALLLPNSPRSGLEVWLAGIPRRIGVTWPWRDLFLNEVVPPAPGTVTVRKRTAREVRARLAAGVVDERHPASAHQLHHYLYLAATLGASVEPLPTSLNLTSEEKGEGAARLWARLGCQNGPETLWLGLTPGAEYGPAKRWLPSRFAEAARLLGQELRCRWMIFGTRKEAALAEETVAKVPGALNLCGRTTLRELMIALAQCRVLLTNDSGPMHLAAALGTPVVALFGSTAPELTGPGLPGDTRNVLLQTRVPCAPCFRRRCPVDFRCMTRLSVEMVVEAVRRSARQGRP